MSAPMLLQMPASTSVRLRVLAMLLVLGPVLLLADTLAVPENPAYPSVGDYAGTELYTRLAMRGEQWLGPYSHFYVAHPGPVYFLAAVPFYVLLGQEMRGIALTALLMNVLSIFGILGLSARGGLASLFAATLGLQLFLASRGADWFYSIWCPNVVILPFGFAILACAAFAARGTTALLLPAGAAASLAAQTHVGTLPVLAIAFALAAASHIPRIRLLWGLPAPAEPPWNRRWILASVVTVFVLWIPTLVEQLMPGGGNLGKIMSITRAPNGLSVWQLAGTIWGPAFTFVVGKGAYTAALAASIVAVVALAYAVSRRRDPWPAALAILSLAGLAVALFVSSRVPLPVYGYAVRWTTMLALGGLIAIGAALAARLGPVVPASWQRVALAATLLAAAGIATANARATLAARASWTTTPSDRVPDSTAAGRLADEISASLIRSGAKRPLLEVHENTNHTLALGLVLALDKRGVSFAVRPFGAFRLGGRWTPRGSEDATIALRDAALPGGGGLLVATERGQYVYLTRS
jgi:hypothetical protein